MSTDLINKNQEELQKELMEESDYKRSQEIIDIFNYNLKKKEAIRKNVLSDIQDKIISQIAARVSEKGNNFDNADLLKYYDTINKSINSTVIDSAELPNIQINQQINVNTDADNLDIQSRQRVLSAVNNILKSIKATPDEEEIEVDFDDDFKMS